MGLYENPFFYVHLVLMREVNGIREGVHQDQQAEQQKIS